ncbi:MAG TPA: calcium/sodium antiporter [Chromatiaceae bacterium]|jgi:cation:H+ antiporter|nr:calcium/sodium antiporter [Chromatiaceae bacterium]HIB83359.1 calcium/sodium antiporter [Chromatiaceae bacterium]HIN83016.1 calcium/sodium antiporter [Chromatiales bacterium]HIO15039.1 calcium/sodium antiporter [Chromatiales bacterium]HIO54360.1 calcium/sodium antiporter [Chromatiales bacterium]
MLISTLAILGGLALLVWGADRFVIGASALACNLGVSPLIIGLTIVGFGTSVPEILVSATASLQGNPELAVGNALGSNIANIALILGIAALIRPLMIHSRILRREYWVLVLVTALALGLVAVDNQLDFDDGLILLTTQIAVLGLFVYLGLRGRNSDPIVSEYESEIPQNTSTASALMWLFIGLIALLLSSRVLVWGAVDVAHAFGISDLIIGLTIVAVGTSLPELAATVAGVLKNENDIAIGNVIGSNIYNLLAVMCVPGLIHPTAVPILDQVLWRDYGLMVALTLALGLMSRSGGRINRGEGMVLLSVFCGYQFFLFSTIAG